MIRSGHAPGVAVARELHLDAVGVAADAGFVGAVDEIAPLHGRAVGHRLERRVVVIEQVHEALAGVVVVLQPLVEVGLLEHDAVVDAGHLVAVAGSAPARTLSVIGLGPAGRAWPRGYARMRRTSSSVICPPRLGATRAISRSLVSRTSCRASKLKSSAAASIQVSALPDRPVEQVVGGNQVLIDGVAQVRQIDAAEGPVPVAAVALAAVELEPGLFDQLGIDRVAGRGRGDRLLHAGG